MGNQQYQLTLSERQAQVLARALELYARIGMGQFKEIRHVFSWNLQRNTSISIIDALLDHIHTLLTGLPANAYHGIRSPELHDDFRVAFDLEQVIRHRLAWDENPQGGHTVDFREPMRTSTQETFAKIEQKGEENVH